MLLDALYLVLAALSAPWWLRRRRCGWRERFGHTGPIPGTDRRRVLIHAVSVGEVNLTRSLVRTLAAEADVIVSVTTDTGIARARELYGTAPGVTVVRYPLDASWMVRRFLDAVRPDAVGLIELELWPNFARACRRRGVPLAILNGRLSERSFSRYRLARPILGGVFRSLAACAVQDEAYRRRFIAVGVPADRCSVLGSMKWDAAGRDADFAAAESLARDLGIDRSRPLIVAGSTAPDEHALLHAATPPGVQLLCAPRRPEWFDGAQRDLPGCVRRSAGNRGAAADRFLLDTIGELRLAYAMADVAVVGRSFGGLYGSDPMEPASLGKPVVIGPSVADFESSVRALRDAGGLIQTTREGLGGVLARLIEDRAERERVGAAARACVEANRGATARHADLMLGLLGRTGTSERLGRRAAPARA
ncbi:MAG: hypothetical protein D6693_01725 [Planctomycetota bacterium]|nr:MAG: hypothetical protein D6693_01725 [Planctomycetota bacterium]